MALYKQFSPLPSLPFFISLFKYGLPSFSHERHTSNKCNTGARASGPKE